VDIKKLKPTGPWKSGKYTPVNPKKYIGDIHAIIWRSSWERRFCQYCDMHPNILKWTSEPLAIPYWNPIDKKEHEYFVDYYIKVETTGGNIEEWLIEVKPENQYDIKKKPQQPTGNITEKKIREYNYKLSTWITNRAKFEAATRFAKARGYQFGAINENFKYQ